MNPVNTQWTKCEVTVSVRRGRRYKSYDMWRSVGSRLLTDVLEDLSNFLNLDDPSKRGKLLAQ